MANKFELPIIAPCHWTTPDGYVLAKKYLDSDRSRITCGNLSDEELVLRYESSGSSQLDWISWQTAIKERVRWLSVRVFVYKTQNQKLCSVLAGDVVITINDPEHLHRHELYLPEISDFELANLQYMLSREEKDVKDIFQLQVNEYVGCLRNCRWKYLNLNPTSVLANLGWIDLSCEYIETIY